MKFGQFIHNFERNTQHLTRQMGEKKNNKKLKQTDLFFFSSFFIFLDEHLLQIYLKSGHRIIFKNNKEKVKTMTKSGVCFLVTRFVLSD